VAKSTRPDISSRPGLFRRLGAIFYDCLLLTGLLFLATALVLPVNNGEAFSSSQFYFPVYLLIISFLFFAWFWTHGGQTLGMRTWKIKISTTNNQPISWNQAAVRFFAAVLSWGIFGVGFLWVLFNKDNNSWHDILSKSHVCWANQDSGNELTR